MSDFNSCNLVILVGRASTNPDFKKAKNVNTSLSRFSLATNEVFYNRKKKETKSKVEYHYIVVWGKYAEACHKYVKKGRLLAIRGKLRHRAYKDDNGIKRKITEVHAEEVTFLGKREDYKEEEPQEEQEDSAEGNPF